jgi:glycosyltransferase involved in cell wall biosynthesis
LRIRAITSTPLDVQRGSGTYVGISTLLRNLEALGAVVDLVTPKVHLPVYTAERILFNEALPFRNLPPCDVEVGFDLDGYRLAGRSGVPHVASLKGVIADEMRFETGFTHATMALQARCEAAHVRRATAVVTTSRYAAERIQELYGIRRVRAIVPELIDLDHWRRLAAEAATAPDPGKFTVLCVCRLYPRKRIPVLLGAAARLRTRIPELEVRIVGEGPEASRLRVRWSDLDLRKIVHWLGDVSQARLSAEYARCDVFCLPSVQEGFGIVFLEAMAAGKPIVAARAAAVPEVVRNGVLVDAEDERAMANAIEDLYRNPARRLQLGEAGRLQAQQYDARLIAQQFLSELAGIVQYR